MTPQTLMHGTGVFPDVGVGRVVLLNNSQAIREMIPFYCILEKDVQTEVNRFFQAVETTKLEIEELKKSMSEKLSASHLAIFDAHLLVLDDSLLMNKTVEHIKKNKHNAEHAFYTIMNDLLKQFAGIDDAYLKEKSEDLHDISSRVIHNLMHKDKLKEIDSITITEPTILVAQVIHPSDLKLLSDPNIVGIATDLGGKTTHTAIIAKALELPAVVGLHDVTRQTDNGEMMVVDGIEGQVLIRPSENEIRQYNQKHQMRIQLMDELKILSDLKPLTKDGVPVSLLANIELEEEVEKAKLFRAEGIGLYRSEFIFLTVAPLLPTEAQHFAVYKNLVEKVKGEIVVRTLDLGGEKFFHEVLETYSQQNPVLGLRAVRFCMTRKDIFRTQLRAILRASALSNRLRLMFPLISGVDELKSVLDFLETVKSELDSEGISYNHDIKIGIMIEVPSAAAIPDLLAHYVDFFSIGTNDLIQYFLAIDRTNDEVNYLYQPLHPGLLRLLQNVFQAGETQDVRVAVCGEMAGNPRFTLLLLGLGLREFSMTPSSIPVIKKIVTSVTLSQCKKIASDALKMDASNKIEAYIERANKKLIPEFERILKSLL
ncbi:MAG: phosphoenolpyruvate--protein phosphotransferase [Acidobacteria bacterium]|nr:MAG: phosphoenolpyruvate--protein phosphotransferase [Acidobacteriota bacterium]